MTRTRTKTFSMYRVTASDVPDIKVGSLMVDEGVRLVATWYTLSEEEGITGSATGKRIGRLCPTCRLDYQRATNLGHPGPCGVDTPPAQPDDEG